MQLLRLAESTELNNAWIVGIAATGSLVAVWLLVALSTFVIRRIGQVLRIQALESFIDDYARKARLVAGIASFTLVVAAAATLGYALWQHKDLQPEVDRVLAQITNDALLAVARSIGVVSLFVIAFYGLKAGGHRAIGRIHRRVSPREMAERQRMFLERFFLHLPSVINLVLAYILLDVAAGTFRLPAVVEWLLLTTIYVLLMFVGGRALIVLAHFLSERLLASWESKIKGSKLEEYYAAVRRLLPIVQRSIEAIVYVSVATLVVHRFEALEPFSPYGPLLIRVISMFLAASVLVEVLRVLVAKLLLAAPSSAPDAQRRRITFIGLIQNILKYLVYFCVGLMVLKDLGVDPTPILAGAGILGITVGLGAQKIVQDLLAGLLLLFEDQILQGDYIRIGDTEGVVEQLSLRITRVRDRLGRLHILRNGEVQNVINYSRGWTLTVVEMSVAYEDDLGKAMRVIAEVCAQLPATMTEHVVEPPAVKGIETIGESSLIVRIETKVAPGSHYDVKRTLNRMLVEAFNANHLEIPYPKSVKLSPEPRPFSEPS
ncbi:MAG TPA: mechanosensitive ion channel family protein [Kofleriaceae bacterium]|jgi:small conductance mechanosensitive channel|nr:mechanosensitive ion channel family protein [Kofleriaceae bacterium]